MPDPHQPVTHLAHGVEELLRAFADGIAIWRERVGGETRDEPADPLSGLATLLLAWVETGAGSGLDSLRAALDEEVKRWSKRADADPAARRVAEVFEAIREVIHSGDAVPARPSASRRAPPRKVAR